MSDLAYAILVVDDDPQDVDIMADMAATTGHQVTPFDDPYRALQAFMKAPAPLVITDLNMPHIDGFEMIKKMKARSAATNFIVVTGEKTIKSVVEARDLGVDYLFFKPASLGALKSAIDTMFRRYCYWLDRLNEVGGGKQEY